MANLSNNDLIVVYVRSIVGGTKRLIVKDYIQSQEELLTLQPQSDQIFIRYHLSHAPKEELPKYLSTLNKLGTISQLLKVTGDTDTLSEDNKIRGLVNITSLPDNLDTLLNFVGEPNHSFFIAECKWVYNTEQIKEEIEEVKSQLNSDKLISTDFRKRD